MTNSNLNIVGAQATGPMTVRLGFEQPVTDAGSLVFTSEALDRPAVPVSPADVQVDGNTEAITLDTEMTPDVRYQVTVAAPNAPSPLLSANRIVFTGFRPQRPANRRFDLWSMLPQFNRREDATGDLRRFIACLQEVTDLLLADIDRFRDIFDIERAPESFLGLILRDLGNPFAFDLDEQEKRRLASVLVEMYRTAGTAAGLRNAIRFFLGLEAEIVAYASEALTLGESELSHNWILGPSDQFSRYAFEVRLDVAPPRRVRQQLEAIVQRCRPAHTHFVRLIVPEAERVQTWWELGISATPTSTVLARDPTRKTQYSFDTTTQPGQ
jgi:phage tail-like protein